MFRKDGVRLGRDMGLLCSSTTVEEAGRSSQLYVAFLIWGRGKEGGKENAHLAACFGLPSKLQFLGIQAEVGLQGHC